MRLAGKLWLALSLFAPVFALSFPSYFGTIRYEFEQEADVHYSRHSYQSMLANLRGQLKPTFKDQVDAHLKSEKVSPRDLIALPATLITEPIHPENVDNETFFWRGYDGTIRFKIIASFPFVSKKKTETFHQEVGSASFFINPRLTTPKVVHRWEDLVFQTYHTNQGYFFTDDEANETLLGDAINRWFTAPQVDGLIESLTESANTVLSQRIPLSQMSLRMHLHSPAGSILARVRIWDGPQIRSHLNLISKVRRAWLRCVYAVSGPVPQESPKN